MSAIGAGEWLTKELEGKVNAPSEDRNINRMVESIIDTIFSTVDAEVKLNKTSSSKETFIEIEIKRASSKEFWKIRKSFVEQVQKNLDSDIEALPASAKVFFPALFEVAATYIKEVHDYCHSINKPSVFEPLLLVEHIKDFDNSKLIKKATYEAIKETISSSLK